MQRAIIIVVLAIKYILIEAEPICTLTANNQRDVTCVAGKLEFILVRGLVSNNNETRRITLSNCKIIYVGSDAFEELPALEYLDLSNNRIDYLTLGVFDGFKRLKFLNLSYNEIKGFPQGLFHQKPNLEVLDLKGNSIINLEQGIFDPMKKLKHVDLSSNALLGRILNVFVFGLSTHIQFMDFSRNNMSDSPDIFLDAFEELDFLNLDRCQLNEVPKFATKSNLKTMTHLMLSTNNIKAISDSEIFMYLENLEILNLSYNVIESITADAFTPLKKLKIIKLMNNRLTQITDTLFRNIPNLNNVDLSHNLIEFVPVNAFRSSPIKHLNLSDNRFSYLTDNFCLELKNSGGGLVKFYFNQNPWQCACLRDILNEVKNFGIVYSHDKYTGDVPVCVTNTNGFNCMRQMQENKNYVDLYYNSIAI